MGAKNRASFERAFDVSVARAGVHPQPEPPLRRLVLLRLHGAEPRDHVLGPGMPFAGDVLVDQPRGGDRVQRHLFLCRQHRCVDRPEHQSGHLAVSIEHDALKHFLLLE